MLDIRIDIKDLDERIQSHEQDLKDLEKKVEKLKKKAKEERKHVRQSSTTKI